MHDSHMRLRLFPQPGFSLSNVAVADDPGLSAEPLLRADEVSASLRLSSLWRGRLEIARLSFPYIEADGGRINLKIGQEKIAYALTDADFALWLASEDQWEMRLQARP